MDRFKKLLDDARLHVNEAERKIIEWKIKYGERQRHLSTIEIVKDKK